MNNSLLIDIICTVVNYTLSKGTGTEKVNMFCSRVKQLECDLDFNRTSDGYVVLKDLRGKRVASIQVWKRDIVKQR